MLPATVCIADLDLDALVGVFPKERDQLQPVRVQVELQLDITKAAEEERLQHTVDYVMVQRTILFLLGHSRYRLLETAAKVISAALLARPEPCEERSVINQIKLRLVKPGALDGRGLPSLELEARPANFRLEHVPTSVGQQHRLYKGKDAEIYRYVVRGKSVLELASFRQSVLILSAGFTSAQGPIAPGIILRGDEDNPVRLEVASDQAMLLGIDRHYDDIRHPATRHERTLRTSIFPSFKRSGD
jgi:dihydroneopterin aldolase